jgi:hypothetical protein
MQARRVLTGYPGRSVGTVADCGLRWVERGAADPLARALTYAGFYRQTKQRSVGVVGPKHR